MEQQPTKRAQQGSQSFRPTNEYVCGSNDDGGDGGNVVPYSPISEPSKQSANPPSSHPTIQPSIQRPHTLVSARGNLENFKTIHDLLCEQAIYSFYSACISSASFAIASSSSSISFEIFYFQINIGKLFSRIRNIKQKEKHLNCFNYNFTVGKFKITFFG